jgi:hypothetical protein
MTKFSWRELLYKTERIYDGMTGHWRDEHEIQRQIDSLIEVMRQQGVDIDTGENLDATDQS